MKNLKGTCVFAQSGGPTAVINSSLAGVVTEALASGSITNVLCAEYGVKGILGENFFDMRKEDPAEIAALKNTPAMAFGSVRYKLKDYNDNEADYRRLLEVFDKYDVKYFFYNGGNDSMDTCAKISAYMKREGYPVNVVGIPKTIDNDLVGTDHCPGYGSAAKYIATTIAEVSRDARIYDAETVIIVEIMGRDAGWLAASASLAGEDGADIVCLPETPFDAENFIERINGVLKKKKYCVAAVSEGIKFANGKYVGEDDSSADVFGHAALGGVCNKLKSLVTKRIKTKCKAIELNILQRCAAHIASATDIDEAFDAGRNAVIKAVNGETDVMVGIERKYVEGRYVAGYSSTPLSSVANLIKYVPTEWIAGDGMLTNEFRDYALPLIKGESKYRTENGLPSYAKLRRIKFTV